MSYLREYSRYTSAVFGKTKGQWGELSNMARGFPLSVNDINIQSSELLYQAMRFTNYPDIQKQILSQKNPMRGKLLSRQHIDFTRPDWMQYRVRVMKWVLRIKLCQHPETFANILLMTGDKPIVEYSKKDPFWGAKLIDKSTLAGENVLGRLLMQIREKYDEKGYDYFREVRHPGLDNFSLLGEPVRTVMHKDSVPLLALPADKTGIAKNTHDAVLPNGDVITGNIGEQFNLF